MSIARIICLRTSISGECKSKIINARLPTYYLCGQPFSYSFSGKYKRSCCRQQLLLRGVIKERGFTWKRLKSYLLMENSKISVCFAVYRYYSIESKRWKCRIRRFTAKFDMSDNMDLKFYRADYWKRYRGRSLRNHSHPLSTGTKWIFTHRTCQIYFVKLWSGTEI